MSAVDFGEVVLFSDHASVEGHRLPESVRWVPIEPLRSIEAYSNFMLKALAPHIQTSHVLVIQWDGFVLNGGAWTPRFLEYDYIGAPWNHLAGPWTMGNGGFSLRSRRLLLALQDPALAAHHPEDVCICREHRAVLEQQGIRFAPEALARRFAVEDNALADDVFGFHGIYHLPHVLPADQVLALMRSLDVSALLAQPFGALLRELTRGARRTPELRPALVALQALIAEGVTQLGGVATLTPEALSFCKALIRHGQHAEAARVLRARQAALGGRSRQLRLWLRLWANQLRFGLRRARR